MSASAMPRRASTLWAAALIGCSGAQVGGAGEAPTGSSTASATAEATAPRARRASRRAPTKGFLHDGVAERNLLRTWIVQNDPLVYAEGRTPIAKAPRQQQRAVQAIVVEQVGEYLRVVLDGHDVRLMFLAPPSCTGLAVKRAVSLSTVPDAPPPEGEGVRLAAGVLLVQSEVRGAAHDVQGDADGVLFDGWLDDDAIDRAFVAAPFVAGKPDGLVLHDALVTDSEGQLITRLPRLLTPGAPNAFELLVETGAKTKPGFKQITYKNKSVEIRGWVRDADYQPLPPDAPITTHGSGWGDGGAMSGHATARLRPGDRILDEEGALVGVVKNETTFYMRDRPCVEVERVAGWIHVTGIGFVLAYARFVDVRPR